MSIYQRFDELVGLPVHLEHTEKEVLTIELPGFVLLVTSTSSVTVSVDLGIVRETLLVKTGLESLTLKRKHPRRKSEFPPEWQ